MLDLLRSERFVDHACPQVYAALLDEGIYHCSISTMYRLLREHDEVKERRNQRRHPSYSRPELLASGPRQLWTWDITRLKGPQKCTFYHLYVILDVFSRYVVGWMVANREDAELAHQLIKETCLKQRVGKGHLTLHADRGSSMKSKPVAALLDDLGVVRSHSRPHVSNDNPFSESQFKTMKYRPTFPERFKEIQDARRFSQEFFAWYNKEHHHSGLALLTPEVVHYGQAEQVIAARQQALNKAHAAHPERFVRKAPVHARLPDKVYINKPEQSVEQTTDCQPVS